MPSRRVLITGLSTYWGGRLAQALEGDASIEAIIGVDNEEPSVELERTEYVKVGTQHALLRRVVEAAEIDTVVDTRLVVDSSTTSPREAHENNIIGTMNILAACNGPDCCVRKFVFKSSTHLYGSEQDDPAFFDETMPRPHSPRTPIERDICEAEASLAEFADRHPTTAVTILRFANVLGPDVRTSHIALFSLPALPMILGFDPRYQFVHEDDVVHALEHVVQRQVPGIYNVAADGVLTLSEVAGLLGKPYAPVLPPWGTGLVAGVARRLGVKLPPEMLNQLRFGRGVDNRRFKARGFAYGYTSREAVSRLAEHLRLHPVLRAQAKPYRYEREVEEFLRWSPNVRAAGVPETGALSRQQMIELRRLLAALGPAGEDGERRDVSASGAAGPARGAPGSIEPGPTGPAAPADSANRGTPARDSRQAPRSAPVEHYDDLGAEEVISLLGSLDDGGLLALRDHERDHRGRGSVLGAIESVLARRDAARG
ncbi:MAG: NAD-dependent epimerase/dehydratase family protein [Thermoleophilaceae bacterium]